MISENKQMYFVLGVCIIFSILIIIFAPLQNGGKSIYERNTDPNYYKTVVDVKEYDQKYKRKVTKQSGGNTLQRGIGGAGIGGAVDIVLGGSGLGGAIVGGVIGASTTEDPTFETYDDEYTMKRYDIYYSDGSIDKGLGYDMEIGEKVVRESCTRNR